LKRGIIEEKNSWEGGWVLEEKGTQERELEVKSTGGYSQSGHLQPSGYEHLQPSLQFNYISPQSSTSSELLKNKQSRSLSKLAG
jgi:hypothetical protein